MEVIADVVAFGLILLLLYKPLLWIVAKVFGQGEKAVNEFESVVNIKKEGKK